MTVAPVVGVVGARALRRDLKHLTDDQSSPLYAGIKAAGLEAVAPIAAATRSALPVDDTASRAGALAASVRVSATRTGARVRMGYARTNWAGGWDSAATGPTARAENSSPPGATSSRPPGGYHPPPPRRTAPRCLGCSRARAFGPIPLPTGAPSMTDYLEEPVVVSTAHPLRLSADAMRGLVKATGSSMSDLLQDDEDEANRVQGDGVRRAPSPGRSSRAPPRRRRALGHGGSG